MEIGYSGKASLAGAPAVGAPTAGTWRRLDVDTIEVVHHFDFDGEYIIRFGLPGERAIARTCGKDELCPRRLRVPALVEALPNDLQERPIHRPTPHIVADDPRQIAFSSCCVVP